MKYIKILHAHNYGHKNIGDDAMANNVYRKLSHITNKVWTISTYSPPEHASKDQDIKSISGMINNYDIYFIKLFLVAISKLKLKTLYMLYSYFICELIYIIAFLNKRMGFPVLAFGKIKRLVWGLSQCEIYIRSGSGSLNDIWFWSSMYPQYTEARIAKLYGAKVFFSGQGIGPLTTNFRLKILGDFANICNFITLRDPINSAALLGSSSAKYNNWDTVGDDAIDYPKEVLPQEIEDIISGKRIIVCQFRPTDYESKIDDKYWLELSKYLKIISEQHELMLIAISFSTGLVNDLEPAKKINKYAEIELLKIIEYNLTPGQAKTLLSYAEFSIGQSYHFGVFSLAENTPFIGLYSNDYYHDKLTGLLELYDLSDNAIRFDDLIKTPLLVENILHKNSTIKNTLKDKNLVLNQKANNIFSTLIG